MLTTKSTDSMHLLLALKIHFILLLALIVFTLILHVVLRMPTMISLVLVHRLMHAHLLIYLHRHRLIVVVLHLLMRITELSINTMSLLDGFSNLGLMHLSVVFHFRQSLIPDGEHFLLDPHVNSTCYESANTVSVLHGNF